MKMLFFNRGRSWEGRELGLLAAGYITGGNCVQPSVRRYERIILLLAVALLILLIINGKIRIGSSNIFNNYLLPALLWAAAAFFLAFRWPRPRAAAKLRFYPLVYVLSALCGGFHILFYFAGGLLDGFGRSPYSFTPWGLVLNFVYLSCTLAGMELSRAYLVNVLARQQFGYRAVLIAVFFALFEIPLIKLLMIKDNLDLVKTVGMVIMPAISSSVLATYLAFLAGPVPALIYRGLIYACQWFCPMLPDLQWTTAAFTGTLIPYFSFLIVQNVYLVETRAVKRSTVEREGIWSWIVTSVLSVLLIWFAVGLFPVYPSVILSGSMEPVLHRGDIVLVQKINQPEKIQPGEIIQFRQGKVRITHRVIASGEDGRGRFYITRGDNNRVPDSEPVRPEQVTGRVKMVIPRAGWATLAIRTLLNRSPAPPPGVATGDDVAASTGGAGTGDAGTGSR